MVGGTTGESPTVTEPEQLELLKRAARACAGSSVALIAGMGGSSTVHSVERARRLGEAPVDGLLSSRRPTTGRRRKACTSTLRRWRVRPRVPIILYNVPGRTCVDMLPATVARLAKLPGIVAIKEAVAPWSGSVNCAPYCPVVRRPVRR